jgi:hypothetical protein
VLQDKTLRVTKLWPLRKVGLGGRLQWECVAVMDECDCSSHKFCRGASYESKGDGYEETHGGLTLGVKLSRYCLKARAL